MGNIHYKTAIKAMLVKLGVFEFILKRYLRLRTYKPAREKRKKYNSTGFQKNHWEEELLKYKNSDKDPFLFGDEWGDLAKPDSVLGNYLGIREVLLNKISGQSTVLEIGTLGGKWTKYMFGANKIICVDINTVFIDFVKELFPESISKLEFYVSKGNELTGIADSSVDLVFSMDTLVRVEKKI